MTAVTEAAGPFGFSDAARRISDAMRQAIVDGHRNRWMAFALEDGRGDGRIYDTRADAVRFHTNLYAKYLYLVVPWDDVTPRSAEVQLKVFRQLQDIGQHPDDPEVAGQSYMMDSRREAYPALDGRRLLVATRRERRRAERRSRGGIILP